MKTLFKLLIVVSLSSTGWAQSVITTFAGAPAPFNGAQATSVSFTATQSVIPDGAGGFYFSTDEPMSAIWRVATNGTTSLIAGDGSGYGGDGGPATAAKLSGPTGLALDSAGNLFIADTNNNRIRKVTPAGIISTVAGIGTPGFSGDGGPATTAQINHPFAVAFDSPGNMLITDSNNNRIRKVTPDGVISTIAGTGTFGFGGDGGPAVSAQFSRPTGIAIDASGTVFVSDSSNSRVRKITAAGIVSTVTGNGSFNFGGDNGPAASGRVSSTLGLAVDGSGNLFIADTFNQRIRKISTAGIITTIAGDGQFGFGGDGLVATSAELASPRGVAVDSSGNVFIADSDNQRIRKIDTSGIISAVAGNGTRGFSGDGGPAAAALLNQPQGLAIDPAGNLLIADTRNNRIRKVTPAGIISTFAGGGSGSSGDGGPPTSAVLSSPSSVAVQSNGVVFIAECPNRIRIVDLSIPLNIHTHAAGVTWSFCSTDYYYDLISAGGVAVSGTTLFVADTFHYRVEKLPVGGLSTVVAGNGTFGFAGDGGPGTSARLSEPRGIAADAAGNLYIADSYNNRIRKVTPAGVITTIAGSDFDNDPYYGPLSAGYGGDGGPAVNALLNFPSGVAVDANGNIFIADTNNNRIRKIDQNGIITTVAGSSIDPGLSGDGGPPTLARLNAPQGVAVDAAGNLYISDTGNHRVRKVTFALTVPTLERISSTFGAQGSSQTVTLDGTSFAAPLVINGGTGITVSNVQVASETHAIVTLNIAPNATSGPRTISVTTALGTSSTVPFDVVPPFPDLSVLISQAPRLEVGFNGSYTVAVTNTGVAATTGPIVVTSTLPVGLTFVSGTGSGWSCSASGQIVSCTSLDSVDPGAVASPLSITVDVGTSAGSSVTHSVTASTAGDLITGNNSHGMVTGVLAPFLNFTFSPATPQPGTQATVSLSLSQTFTHDITGTLTLGFSSTAVHPADDPAVQFSTGGRTVNFTIPANTTVARFGSNTVGGPVAFQTGTVAGTLSFSVMLQTGSVQTPFGNTRAIPSRVPAISSVRTESAGSGSFNVLVNSSSTTREVTSLILAFLTSPAPTLSCGAVAGCTVSGTVLTLDVRSLFDTWFVGNSQFGSLTNLRVPLTISGTLKGSIQVSLRNGVGTSSGMSFSVP